MNITVVGCGYVGLSNALLLSQNNNVIVLDIDQDKVAKINRREPFIFESEIEDFLINKKLNLKATVNAKNAYQKADFVIVATPTDYDIETNFFNTKSVDHVISEAHACNPKATIVSHKLI